MKRFFFFLTRGSLIWQTLLALSMVSSQRFTHLRALHFLHWTTFSCTEWMQYVNTPVRPRIAPAAPWPACLVLAEKVPLFVLQTLGDVCFQGDWFYCCPLSKGGMGERESWLLNTWEHPVLDTVWVGVYVCKLNIILTKIMGEGIVCKWERLSLS